MSGSSQNIETISTQFRILSTVKATMLSKLFYFFLFRGNSKSFRKFKIPSAEEEKQRAIEKALDVADIDQGDYYCR